MKNTTAHERPIPEVRTEASCGLATVYVRVEIEEIDLYTVPSLEHQIDLANAADTRRITLDMSCVEFMDGSGISTIERASVRLRSRGIQLTLRSVGEQPHRLLGFVGLDRLIEA